MDDFNDILDDDKGFNANQPEDYIPPRPKNWLTEAIIVTIICCWPIGIVAIIKASEVNSKYNAGDYDGAQNSARQAENFTKWSAGLAIVGLVLYFLLIGLMVAADM